MKIPSYDKAPDFDPAHMERRKGPDRDVPIPLDYEQAHAHAKQANTAYRMAKAERATAAGKLASAKLADGVAKKDLEEAFEEAEELRAEADSLTRTISAKVELHFDYTLGEVREVRTDKGYEGIQFDVRTMTAKERSDILAGIGKKPQSKPAKEPTLKLEVHVETAWEHRHPADRDAFVKDVMGYGGHSLADVETAVDAFLAEQALAAAVLAKVALWLVDDKGAASDGYAGETHEQMIDLLAGHVYGDLGAVELDGVEVDVDLDHVRDAVEITVTRAQRDRVVSKLSRAGYGFPLPKGKTVKVLAIDTGLSAERVAKLLASAKTDGLVDKPSKKRSWVRLPVPELQRLTAALPALNEIAPGGVREGKTVEALAHQTRMPEKLVAKLLFQLQLDGVADRLAENATEWVRLKQDESVDPAAVRAAARRSAFDDEVLVAALLATGPARERVLADLVGLLPLADALPLAGKTPKWLAHDAGLHILQVGKLLAFAKADGLAKKLKGRDNLWVRLPAAPVAETTPAL